MAICDVEGWNLAKLLDEERGVLDRAFPHGVADLIFTGHVTVWLRRLHDMSHACLDRLLIILECEENWAHICTLDISKFGPISLLLGQSELVALDPISLVVLNGGQADQTVLNVVAHGLPVDVEALIAILDEVALLDEVLQVFAPTLINLIIVRIHRSWESDLWLVDVQEAHGIAVCHRACLFGVQCVVGWADDPGAVILVG